MCLYVCAADDCTHMLACVAARCPLNSLPLFQPAQVLLQLVRPYTRVRLSSIASALHVPEHEVESLLVGLILDNRIQGHVDQARQGRGCNQGATTRGQYGGSIVVDGPSDTQYNTR